MINLHDLIIAGKLCGEGSSPAPPEPVLKEKTVTANGTYNAEDDNADGYSSVTAAVPQLPVEFLKYIKSVGNSVILTDIVPNYNWDVFFDLMIENLVATGAYEILGINYPTEHFLMTFPYYQGFSTIDYVAWAGFTPSSGDTYGITREISVPDEANMQNTAIMRRGSGGCIFGKHNYTMTDRTDDTTPTHPIVISGIDEGGTIYPYSRGELTIYGIKICLTGALVHSLVPAQAKAGGRAGLYDLVTGKWYPSDSNFDDFVKGV